MFINGSETARFSIHLIDLAVLWQWPIHGEENRLNPHGWKQPANLPIFPLFFVCVCVCVFSKSS